MIPPSDNLIHYFGGILRERFSYGSAYMVFHNEEAIAAFKANNRDGTIEVTDVVGDSELETAALRVITEFSWDHDTKLTGKLYEKHSSSYTQFCAPQYQSFLHRQDYPMSLLHN